MNNYSPVTLGESITRFEGNGIVLTETKHEANLSLPRHGHEHDSVVLVLDGSFVENADKRSYVCSSNSVLIKPGGIDHTNKYDNQGAHCLILEVKPERFGESHWLRDVFSRIRFLEHSNLSGIISRIRREIKIADSSSPIAIEGLALAILAELRREHRRGRELPPPSWLAKAVEHIHSSYTEPISLSTVANAVGLHRSYVSRIFKSNYDLTVGEYVRLLRLEHAARELAMGTRSLSEISNLAGFYDQSHFCRNFRARYGMTPAEYRVDAR